MEASPYDAIWGIRLSAGSPEDVYKRQVQLDEQAAAECRRVLSAFFAEMTQWEQYMEPVSYTHLAIEAIPEQERGYLLTVKLSRAYSNLAVLGDHGEHGTDAIVPFK